ncbi:hypothetical protein [Streptomyces chattanoogensis]|uniref:4Fe-4S Wbl-type domain-containing protein n=1 Tax=Streptomyces chattanoogensis TaxID=66876 RepID=A0A0N0XTK4_9ACTN|nr:hypothetical protein [Streptomyces chattanoogensis]KPC61294.1 hypothetical protein ADL29_25225 [Streptomyces chattanoogensis]
MSRDLKTELALEEQRTLEAVRSVRSGFHGVAACWQEAKAPLFDAAGSGRTPTEAREEAAAVCDRCPLVDTCGFRIAMPGLRSRARARRRP